MTPIVEAERSPIPTGASSRSAPSALVLAGADDAPRGGDVSCCLVCPLGGQPTRLVPFFLLHHSRPLCVPDVFDPASDDVLLDGFDEVVALLPQGSQAISVLGLGGRGFDSRGFQRIPL